MRELWPFCDLSLTALVKVKNGHNPSIQLPIQKVVSRLILYRGNFCKQQAGQTLELTVTVKRLHVKLPVEDQAPRGQLSI